MVVRKDLENMGIPALQELLENDLAAYKAVVETMSVEEAKTAEQELIKAMEEYDKYLTETMYELPQSVAFDDKNYSRNRVGEMICYFIEKQEVDWQYTLGLYQMSKLWRGIGSQVGYKEYDSTLRVLGQIKYKGSSEWRDIMIVNEFLRNAHDEYTIDTSYMIYLSKLHNELIDKIQPSDEIEMSKEM